MLLWSRRRGIIMGDDPPYLVVGTEVSAKYKGAFCEAKVRKVVRSVKCKVTFKLGLGTAIITDDQIRGTLRVGATCEAKHPEKKEFLEATINKIQDCSQYTVVFDDGDITTLRRTALCLKSGRHFAESETLDQLPLTHPEHFSNPVIGGRKGRRSRQAHDDSSDDDEAPKKGKQKEEKEADIGKVVCVELGDKKKQKDNWFPGLVVAPTAQDTVRIRVRDEYLVRSFKDGRYFTVPKKEATQFTREIGAKVDNHTLKAAVEKALMYLDKDELPPHWDRDLLFGLDESSGNSDTDAGFDSDSSDDEPREEKDHFVAQLYKFMDDRGTPINKGPTIGSKDVDLYKLFKVVHKLGGYNRVTNHNQWKTVSHKIGFGSSGSSVTNLVKQSYKKFLHSFEDFYRKLGCTMVNHPRGHRSRHRGGRSLIRDCDRATPVHVSKVEKTVMPCAGPSAQVSALVSVSVTPSPALVVSSTLTAPPSNVEGTTVPVAVPVEAAPKVDVATKTLAATEKHSPERSPSIRKPCSTVSPKDSRPVTESVSSSVKVTSVQKTALVDSCVSDKISGVSRSADNIDSNAKVIQDSESIVKVEAGLSGLDNTPEEIRVFPKLEVAVVPKVEKPHAVVNTKEVGQLQAVKVEPKDDPANVSEVHKKLLEEKEDKLHLREGKKEDKSKEKEIHGRAHDAVCEVKPSEEVPKTDTLASCAGKLQLVQERVESTPVTHGKPKLREVLNKVKGKVKKETKGLPMKVIATEKIMLRKKLKAQPLKVGKAKLVQEKKLEEPKKKGEKKPDEEEKQTRSKSKEDARTLKKETPVPERRATEVKVPVRDTRTPVRDTVERMERRQRETRTPIRDSRTPVRDTAEKKPVARDIVEKKPTTREVIEKKLAIRDASEKKVLAKNMVEKKAALRECGEKKSVVRESERRPSVREADKKIPLREVDKRVVMRPKKPDEQSPPLLQKKRGRKRKDTEETPVVEETLGLLPNHIRVGVGDKLKVYYGPTQESKVTYEAKVLEIEEDVSETMYLVHYTGWNTRYDEWIKRGRIAENLSWTPARAKRLQHQGSRSKVSKPTMGKRGRPSLSGRSQDMGVSQPPRSTTPSSVTSCSSRTKSPATPTTPQLPLRRTLRNTSAESLVTGFEFRRRTRRSSGFTDISVASLTETEDEDDDVEDDDDDEEEVDRILMDDAEQETVTPNELVSIPVKNKKETEIEQPARRKGPKKDDGDSSKKDGSLVDEMDERKRPRRNKKLATESAVVTNNLSVSSSGGSDEEQKDKKVSVDLKVESNVDIASRGLGSSDEEQQPTGRDFDLNQIRSELKGIERAVTLEPDDTLVLPTEDKDTITPCLSPPKVSEENTVKPDTFDCVTINEIAESSFSKSDDNCDTSTEDVYEFKEPEPFEFEVRTKRELQEGRRSGRIFDDVIESKLDKSPFPRKRPRGKVESLSLVEGEVKRQYRRTVGRKIEQTSELRRETECEKEEKIVVDVPKSLPNSTTYEDAFDKLCQVKKPCESGKTSEADELGPLSLFGELPGENHDDECEEDSDDRLVISEAEETTVESEGPLFSYSKLFPNLMSSEPSALVLESESSQALDHKSQEPQKHPLAAEATLFGSVFKTSDEKHKGILEQQDKNKNASNECSTKDHNNVVSLLLQPKLVEDYEEDPINAAIQRVFERSLTDEDSSQDIFGEKSQPENFHLILNTKETSCVRKPAFEEEILSDSSDDEESRLIIATKENEDIECLEESREESASEDGPSEHHREDDESTQDAVEVIESADTVCCVTDFKEDATDNSNTQKFDDGGKLNEQNQEPKPSVLKAWLQDSVQGDSWLYSSEKSQDLDMGKMEENEASREVVGKPETSQMRHCENAKPVHNIVIESMLSKNITDDTLQVQTTTLEKLCAESSCTEITKEQQKEQISIASSTAPEIGRMAVREDSAPILEPESDKVVGEDMDTGLCSLLCEETIPGSPPTLTAEQDISPEDDKVLEMPFASALGSNCTPSSVFTPVEFPLVGGRSVSSPSQVPGKHVSGEAALVLDNTPPATPTSSLSTVSGSPRDEPERLSPNLDNESKFHQDSFNIELENRANNKTGHFSEEDSLLNVDMSSSSDARLVKKGPAEKDKECAEAVGKKRRHSRKRSECESKRSRHISGRSHIGGGSDSDDMSENSAAGSTPPANTADSLVSRSPRPSKYNFYVELDPDMDGTQRIALLQQNLQELRKAYMSVKAELACIDRRRKKLRRREREEKAMKQEVSCS